MQSFDTGAAGASQMVKQQYLWIAGSDDLRTGSNDPNFSQVRMIHDDPSSCYVNTL
jgi:hypothetical protein